MKKKTTQRKKSRTRASKQLPSTIGNPFMKGEAEKFESAKQGRPTEEKSVVIKLKPSHLVTIINLIPKTDFTLLEVRMQLIKAIGRHGTDEQRQKIIL